MAGAWVGPDKFDARTIDPGSILGRVFVTSLIVWILPRLNIATGGIRC